MSFPAVALHRQLRAHRAPPLGRGDLDALELVAAREVARRRLRDREPDVQLALHHGEGEAARIDAQPVHLTALVLAAVGHQQAQRVERDAPLFPALGDHARALAGAEQRLERRRGARAEIDHPAARAVRRLAADHVDVGAVLVREPGAEHVEHRDLGARDGAGVLAALLLVAEWALIGIRGGVRAREHRDERVAEDDERIAGDEVALGQTLADVDGVVEGLVDVGEEEFDEPAAHERERERRAAHADAIVIGAHPEHRIRGGDDELRMRHR